MGFLRGVRDHFIERTAPAILNETLMADYGRITAIELDSTAKKLHIEALLRGESHAIRVEIGSYELERRDGRAFFTIKQIETSREWITTLARQELVNRPIPLPNQFSGLLGRLL
jgi:hypothetical protein